MLFHYSVVTSLQRGNEARGVEELSLAMLRVIRGAAIADVLARSLQRRRQQKSHRASLHRSTRRTSKNAGAPTQDQTVRAISTGWAEPSGSPWTGRGKIGFRNNEYIFIFMPISACE